jgi:hypothetical protein
VETELATRERSCSSSFQEPDDAGFLQVPNRNRAYRLMMRRSSCKCMFKNYIICFCAILKQTVQFAIFFKRNSAKKTDALNISSKDDNKILFCRNINQCHNTNHSHTNPKGCLHIHCYIRTTAHISKPAVLKLLKT